MNKQTFLVSRTDRAGDLILTLPIFRELRKNFPESKIIAHVRKYTAPILSLCPEVDEIINDDAYPPGICSKVLANKFAATATTTAIIVHPTSRAILAAWWAQIKKRTGRASNVWQFFLNDRRVQHRSKNEKHEFCYNLDLLAGLAPRLDYSPYKIVIEEKLKIEALAMLALAGFSGQKPVLIHPGHGGSAHNISAAKYAQLAQMLIDRDIPVLVSLGPGEENLKNTFALINSARLKFLSGIPDLAKLAAVFANCAAFVGGSTGPLHLAAALQLPCIAFFPPVKAMTPARWGPVGCKSLVIKPQLDYCNGKCQQCADAGCMERLDIEPAFAWLIEELKYEYANNNK